MPNIENLKKQAKQYLRWHRERYYPVAADIRATLPNFSGLGDEEILRATFRLADAQELVARHTGFDGWQALVSGAQAMTRKTTASLIRPVLTSIEAQLYVADVEASCAFFTSKLG
ncbi:MAG: VOC family protein, partial [Candidatus Eremiobacteraeota bacterium]|nr:VOC family protein [Candidatus Eremiobacteraeota bacterium]